MTPMKSRQKHTSQKPWAQKCPRVSMNKITVRPLAVAKQNKLLSVIKTNKRPLSVSKHNKSLSATTDKRAKKLSKSKNKKLRKRNVSAEALSKKVNKVISGLKQDQLKSRFPREENTKVLRTQIYLKIEKQTPQTEKTYKYREHKSALGHPQQEHQVTTTNTFIKRKIPRINSKRYAQTGAYRINYPCLSPRETNGKTHKEYNASIKVNTKNECLYTKETATQEITSAGPKHRTMNEESYTTPSNKLPDQIFDTQEAPNQEPSEPRAGTSDFEKMMEYPFPAVSAE